MTERSIPRKSALRQWLRLVKVEWILMSSSLRWRIILILSILVPSLYLLIYLGSVWDPSSHSQSLRVGLVDLDQGHAYQSQSVNMGQELSKRLLQKNTFGFVVLGSDEEARRQVRKGLLAFAVVIPKDFSALALPGLSPNEGLIEIYSSAGNHYQTHLMAKKFAEDLDAEINQTLNEQRWKFVLNAPSVNEDWQQLRTALTQINKGVHEISNGLSQAQKGSVRLQSGQTRVSEEVHKIAQGSQQVGQAIRTMEAALPPADDVRQLRVGAAELAQAHGDLDKGLSALIQGSQDIRSGVKDFRQSQENIFWGISRISEWIDPLENGLGELTSGLQRAHQSQLQMKSGSEQLRDSVRTLALGVRDLRAGLKQTLNQIPETQQLSQLESSAHELAAGQRELDQGIKRLHESGVYLSASTDWLLRQAPLQVRLIDGSPEGLAHSVSSQISVVAPVRHLGEAMAPNVIPVAIWLGAGIAIFLIRGRHAPLFARSYSNSVKFLAKASMPVLMVSLQTLMMIVLLMGWFGVTLVNGTAMVVMMAATACAFVLLFMLFIQWFGDVGKAMALLFLALQMSASGGLMPIELSGAFYSALSPWLPMTWVIQGLRAAQFGAFDADWLTPLLLTLLLASVCTTAGMMSRKWHHCRLRQMRPVVDV